MRLSIRSWVTEWKRAATTTSSLEAEQDSCHYANTCLKRGEKKETKVLKITYDLGYEPLEDSDIKGFESKVKQTKQTYSTALTKLNLRVKKLEKSIKITKVRRRARIVVSEDEDAPDYSSKQGRKISDIDEDPNISLVQDEGMTWFQDADAEIQEKNSADTKILLQEEEPTKPVEDQGSGEKGEKEVSTVGAEHSTVIPEVSTAAANLQERLGNEEDVRLQEQLNEEETQRIARDGEIARQLHEEINKVRQERVVAKDDQAHVIDWSDLVVLRYHAQLNRPYSVAEVRKNMVMYLKNQEGYKMNYFKGMKYEDIRPIFEKKTEYEKEKEELKAYLDLVPREEFAMEIESLATKADGGSKNYKIFSEMLDDFDRQDVMDLQRLVEERYATSRPEGYDLMLLGDLKILFQPDEEDEVWKHQHEYNLISWRLFDSCGIHILLMDNGIVIHMMIEKKYLLTQEMLSKMLSRKLEVDHENEMAFELLRYIRTQVQK
ncbi:hypothetical protein Tco_1098039 [Tanacetum coccineum]